MIFRGPTSEAVQLSALDADGRAILSVVTKRTYAIAGADCTLHPTQSPLRAEPRYADDGLTLEEDVDVWPFKALTDVVVRGHAYNHPGKPMFTAGIALDATRKVVRVSGDRRCTIGAGGRVLFSQPTVLEKVALSYALAYGGKDHVAEAAYGNPIEVMARFMPPGTPPSLLSAASPFFYPRNPGGRGYLVEKTRAAIEGLALPNLEHPDDPLTPDRVAAGETNRWAYQPVPASLGWLDYGAFPRLAWLGVLPAHAAGPDPSQLGEVRLGYCPSELFVEKDPPDPIGIDGVQGASLGLRVPLLRGGESVELLNLTPARASLRFRLPLERPRLYVDGRDGTLGRTDPVVHSVVIEPDDLRVSIVWRGAALARRAYGREELKTMPFAVDW